MCRNACLRRWGLEWSLTREGWLASSGDDGLVCIWDTRASSGGHAETVLFLVRVVDDDLLPLAGA